MIALAAAVFIFAPDLLLPYFTVFIVLFTPPWRACVAAVLLIACALVLREGDPKQAAEALNDYWTNGLILGIPTRTFTVGITTIAIASKLVCMVLLLCVKLIVGLLHFILIGAAKHVLAAF